MMGVWVGEVEGWVVSSVGVWVAMDVSVTVQMDATVGWVTRWVCGIGRMLIMP